MVALVLLALAAPVYAVRQGRFDRYIIGINGQAVSGATVEVRRQGATAVQGAQSGATPIVINVVAPGAIQPGDTVVIGTATSPSYTVGTVTATTVQLTAGGAISLSGGERLSPNNLPLPTMYVDSNGVTTKLNPLTSSPRGQAQGWIADGIYDFRVSGAGVTTFLSEDYFIGGVQKAEANTWTATQTFQAGATFPSVTVAPGNLISVDGNDTNLTPDPTCANSGTVGMLTFIDVDETATDVWTTCVGTSSWLVLPNVGSDVAANNEVLTGTGAGTAEWKPFPAGTLNTNENDGTPSVATVGTIKLPNGSIVDETGGVVRFQPGGLRPPFISGRYYDCDNVCGHTGNADADNQGGNPATSLTNTTLTTDQILYVPFYAGYRATFDRVGVQVDAGSPAGNIKFSIYAMDTDGTPGTRLFADTNVVVTGGIAQQAEATVSWQLDPGWYWLAEIPSAALVIKGMATTQARGALGYFNMADLANDALYVMWRENGQTHAGGLPATAGAVVGSTTPRAARIMLRAQ